MRPEPSTPSLRGPAALVCGRGTAASSPASHRSASRVAVVALLGCGLAGLAGCATGIQAGPEAASAGALHGTIFGGNLPVVGATVNLYAAATNAVVTANSATAGTGTSGSSYTLPTGTTLTPLATTSTGAAGSFNFGTAGALGFTCPSANSQLYITASGGNPGLAAGTSNPAIFLVLAFGPCANASTATSLVLNEVTTVAAAYALSGFVPAGGQGFGTAANGATITSAVASSATNTQGLADAFANANNIVNNATGAPYATTPASSTGNSTGTVPNALINTVANILVPCVNSTGSMAAGSSCAALYAAATPPTGGPAAPINIFQAALDIANYPANNVGTGTTGLYALFNNQPSQTLAFTPNLSGPPNDFSIAISYANANVLQSPTAIAIDNTDDVYVAGSTNYSLVEFSPQGVLTPASQVPCSAGATACSTAASGGLTPNVNFYDDNVRNMAFDPLGNLWMADGAGNGSSPAPIGNGILEYTPGGSAAVPYSYAAPGAATPVDGNSNNYAIAVDKLGDVWTSSYKSKTCSAPGTSPQTNATVCGAVEFVKSGSAYTPVFNFPMSASNSATTNDSIVYTVAATAGGPRGLAFDAQNGTFWTADMNENTIYSYSTTPNTGTPAYAPAAPVQQTLNSGANLAGSTKGYGVIGIAIDKTDNAWVVQTGSGSTAVPAAGLYSIAPGNLTATAATGVANAGLNTPAYLTIDGNNNVFVANAGGNSVVVYNPALTVFVSGPLGYAPGAAFGSTTAVGAGDVLIGNKQIAVDRSGAVWTLNPGTTGQLVQILGIASPTQPILALGGYGTKP